jgi:hypothetical protein
MFLYSLETFLYSTLNKASRECDESKVSTLGPFAYALDIIIQNAQKYRADSNIQNAFTIYRGMNLPKYIVD